MDWERAKRQKIPSPIVIDQFPFEADDCNAALKMYLKGAPTNNANGTGSCLFPRRGKSEFGLKFIGRQPQLADEVAYKFGTR